MPKLTAETRWRIRKHGFNSWWQTYALMPDNKTRMPGTVKVFRTWGGAMGYAYLKIAQAHDRLPR
jgi:hypothetical protein